MRIGIDARMYRSSVAGIGRYSQNLIKNLLEIDREDEFVLFMTPADKKEFNTQSPNVKTVITEIGHYSLAEQTKLPKIIAKEKCDLVHFLNFNHPIRYKGKFVITIHDLTLFYYPETAKETSLVKRLAFTKIFKNAVNKAQKVIAVSENTKKDIIEKFKVKEEKIKVIYEAADDKTFTDITEKEIENIKEKYDINTPVILYVGQFRPHKNIPGLIEAFGLLRKEMPCKLVILGKPDPKHSRVQGSIDKIGEKRDIVMPGFVTEKELAAWYKIASVFVFPSFYEGFGLPGLEAMQSGTPVVASKTSSLPEIYQEAAIYFDPGNPQDISDKIKLVLTNKKIKDDLIRKGKEVVQKYSWKETSQETLKLYKNV